MAPVSENAAVTAQRGAAFVTMFTSPLETLDSLRERPQWFRAVLVAGTYSVLVNLYVVQRLGLERVMTKLLRSAPLIDPQGMLQNVLGHQSRVLFFQALATFVGAFVVALVVAKALWLLLTVAGKDVAFKRVIAVVAHASLLTTVVRESALALTATMTRDLDKLDLRNPLATNPGFFVHPASATASRILTSLDVITLANILLLVVGLTKVCERLSPRVATALVVVPWLAWVGASIFISTLS